MKSERRHELQENSLARFMNNLPVMLRLYADRILLGLVVILLYIALGVTALAIDRRALLVSALAYVLYAMQQLFSQFGAVELNVALTALVIGSALLLLSAFWHQARRTIVQPLPESLRERLPLIDRTVASQQAA